MKASNRNKTISQLKEKHMRFKLNRVMRNFISNPNLEDVNYKFKAAIANISLDILDKK